VKTKAKVWLLVALIVVSVVFIGLFSFNYANAGQVYWGSVNSNKFHYPSCRWAKRINPDNLIKFNSRDEALKAGYVPCKVCQP
jgi:methylphosphotriester-DNA--protein-cysteine methyltransferase